MLMPAAQFCETERVRYSVLENGIRVVTQKVETLKSIALGFLFSAGPGDEDSGKSGVAHLTEHLIFGGTKQRNAEEIARLMDASGGRIHGLTTRDYTCYSTVVLDDYRTYSLDLFSDILLNSSFSEQAVSSEKETVRHELASMDDRPDVLAHDRLKALIWKDHHLGRAIGGTTTSVAALERDDVLKFYNDHYRPQRLIIAAAGNVDHEDMLANIRDGFWSMEPGGAEQAEPQPARYHSGVSVATRELSHVYFCLGLRAACYTSDERYSLHLLTGILGGGLSSRLFRRLRQQEHLVYDVQAEYQAYRDDGLLVIEGATAPDLLEEVITAILTELSGIAEGDCPITEDELWIARMQLRAQHMIGLENSHSCMSSLITQALYFNTHIPSGEIVAELESIDLDRMGPRATQILRQGLAESALSVVGPFNEPERTHEQFSHLLAQYGGNHGTG